MKTLVLLLLSATFATAQFASSPAWLGQQVAPAASTCSQWIAQTVGNDYWASGPMSQGIQVTNTITVCKIITSVSTGGVERPVYYTFWSGKYGPTGGTNTLYGISTTNLMTISDAARQWVTNTCSIVLSNDCFLIKANAVLNDNQSSVRWSSSTTNTYAGTSYFVFSSTDKAADAAFILHTQ